MNKERPQFDANQQGTTYIASCEQCATTCTHWQSPGAETAREAAISFARHRTDLHETSDKFRIYRFHTN